MQTAIAESVMEKTSELETGQGDKDMTAKAR